MGQPEHPTVSRAFPVVYASDVERATEFWELLGFRRRLQLRAEGEPGYVAAAECRFWSGAFRHQR
jgi:hypothetical protein